eukprot:GHVT01067105.1.p1 GENE.GHVT01067105.1~~GHVT01067105.1.p1  ORF type:complete len:149 (+),score=22.28 GHVT01067105.1:60-449(+)
MAARDCKPKQAAQYKSKRARDNSGGAEQKSSWEQIVVDGQNSHLEGGVFEHFNCLYGALSRTHAIDVVEHVVVHVLQSNLHAGAAETSQPTNFANGDHVGARLLQFKRKTASKLSNQEERTKKSYEMMK